MGRITLKISKATSLQGVLDLFLLHTMANLSCSEASTIKDNTLNDLFSFDLATKKWTEIQAKGALPSARAVVSLDQRWLTTLCSWWI